MWKRDAAYAGLRTYAGFGLGPSARFALAAQNSAGYIGLEGLRQRHCGLGRGPVST